jgi:copper(I)-binding protein
VCPAIRPPARACEYFAPTLRVYHPWTRATGPQATHAVVCMTFDEVTDSDRLVAVETPVAARAELGGVGERSLIDLPIPAGRETVLTEAGTHVRLVGLRHSLEVGCAYPLKLVFEKGGEVRATLNVDYTRFG